MGKKTVNKEINIILQLILSSKNNKYCSNEGRKSFKDKVFQFV